MVHSTVYMYDYWCMFFLRELGGEITRDGDFQVFEGCHFRNGFMYKNFVMAAIVSVCPSILGTGEASLQYMYLSSGVKSSLFFFNLIKDDISKMKLWLMLI